MGNAAHNNRNDQENDGPQRGAKCERPRTESGSQTHRGRQGRLDNPAREKPVPPVIFGYDIAAYSFARIFYETVGVRSLVAADAMRGPIDRSSIFGVWLVGKGSLDDEAAFLGILDGLACEFPDRRLIPLINTDGAVGFVTRHRDSLSRDWFLPYGDRKAVVIASSEAEMVAIVAGFGLSAPAHMRIDLRESASWEGALGGVTFPVVVKPEEASDLSRYWNQGLRKVLPLETCEATLAIFARWREEGVDTRLIAQELVPGDDTTRRAVNGYVDVRRTVTARGSGRVILGLHQPEYLGNTGIILTEHNPELIEQAKSIVTWTGLRRFFSMDVKADPRDGAAHWFDLDPCIGHGCYYLKVVGVDLTKAMLADMEENGADGALEIGLGQADAAERFCQSDAPSTDPAPKGVVCTMNAREAVFCIIPASLVNRRYTRDADPHARVRRAKKADVVNPLTYSADCGLKWVFYRLTNGLSQRRRMRARYPEPTDSGF